MNKYTRIRKDAEAVAELIEWCKPLNLDVYDDGSVLYLVLAGRCVHSALYRKPWLVKPNIRSIEAAARELKDKLEKGCFISFSDEKVKIMSLNVKICEERTYSLKVPKCSSPDELVVKLDLDNWTAPKKCTGKWRPLYEIPDKAKKLN